MRGKARVGVFQPAQAGSMPFMGTVSPLWGMAALGALQSPETDHTHNAAVTTLTPVPRATRRPGGGSAYP